MNVIDNQIRGCRLYDANFKPFCDVCVQVLVDFMKQGIFYRYFQAFFIVYDEIKTIGNTFDFSIQTV